MNRQQRRANAKRAALDAKTKVHRRKEDQVETELYFTAFGLALTELYGWKAHGILKVWQKADNYINDVVQHRLTFEQMKMKLADSANLECSFR